MKTILFPSNSNKVLFGACKESGERMYLTAPSWDCGWYWGFGYLGNKDCHYHLDGYKKGRNINMYDALLEDYDLNPLIKDNLWVFCELVLSAYTLKSTAEVLGRGGSHMTSNPCKDIIINTDEVERINRVVLPEIFKAIAALLK